MEVDFLKMNLVKVKAKKSSVVRKRFLLKNLKPHLLHQKKMSSVVKKLQLKNLHSQHLKKVMSLVVEMSSVVRKKFQLKNLKLKKKESLKSMV